MDNNIINPTKKEKKNKKKKQNRYNIQSNHVIFPQIPQLEEKNQVKFDTNNPQVLFQRLYKYNKSVPKCLRYLSNNSIFFSFWSLVNKPLDHVP